MSYPCMYFDDETMESCGLRAKEAFRIEIPLDMLRNVYLQEVKSVNRKPHIRRKETDAVYPSDAGCFVVGELWLCLRHQREVSD